MERQNFMITRSYVQSIDEFWFRILLLQVATRLTVVHNHQPPAYGSHSASN